MLPFAHQGESQDRQQQTQADVERNLDQMVKPCAENRAGLGVRWKGALTDILLCIFCYWCWLPYSEISPMCFNPFYFMN